MFSPRFIEAVGLKMIQVITSLIYDGLKVQPVGILNYTYIALY